MSGARRWAASALAVAAFAAIADAAELETHVLPVEHPANPANSVIEIKVRDGGPASFRIVSLNGREVFGADAAVNAAAVSTAAEHPDYSLATRVFRFMEKNRHHDAPLTAQFDWYLSRTLFFNSPGFAACGETARLFKDIATDLGVPVRIWSLGGHVAVEAFSGGRWQYYDPDYEVFFLNQTGQIASLAELIADPQLILNPLYPLPITWPWDPYTEHYASLLTTTEDNWIGEDNAPVIPAEPVIFTLPANARIQLPAVFAELPSDLWGYPVPTYTNMKIKYPPGFTGTLSHNLLLHDIQGQGSVKLDGQTFQAGLPPVFDFIDSRTKFIKNVEIISSGGVDVVYLMNPSRWKLEEENVLVLERFSGAPLNVRLIDIFQTGPAVVDALPGAWPALLAALIAGSGIRARLRRSRVGGIA